jgi:hypothetical protein
MAVNLSPVGGVAAQFFNNDGTVLSGGKIYTYSAGTTTPAATYTTSSGSIAHSNPIILTSAGRVPSGEIWLTDGISYKFVLNDANDVLIATYDNITGINSNFVNYTNSQEIQTATANQTVFTLTTMQYQPATGSLSVFVDGVNQYGPGAQYAFTETSSTVVTFVSGLHVGASVKFTTSAINASSYGNASQITYTPAGTGAVNTNVQAKLRETVSVMDFGAVMDNSAAGVRTANKAALVAALATLNKVAIPKGTLWIDGDINIPENSSIQGMGALITTIKGSGDLFKVTTGYGAATFADLEIINDATLGKLYTLSLPQDSGQATFQNVNFGTSNFHVYQSTAFAIVNAKFVNCRFNGAANTSRYYTSLWAYAETDCYSWYNATGLNVNGTSMGCSINNSVYEHHTNNAIRLSNVATSEQLSFSVNNTYFEFNGSSSTSDVYLSTSGAGRLRDIIFNNCIFQNPDAAATPVRVVISAGGGGNIDNVLFIGGSVIGSLPLVTDTSVATLINVYAAIGLANYANVRIPNSAQGAVGQVTPRAIPANQWNTDFTNDSIVIANNATYDLALGSGVVNFIGVGGDCSGMFLCAGGTTTLVATNFSSASNTIGTAGKMNLYYNAGTSKYRLQNLTGASSTISMSMQRLRTTA